MTTISGTRPLAGLLPRPQIEYTGARDFWRLTQDYTFETITVPAGFVFDLASVPRLFWPALAPWELGVPGPLVHDYGYDGHMPHWTRSEVDDLFYRAMRQDGVCFTRRRMAWWMVRLFGGKSWRGEKS